MRIHRHCFPALSRFLLGIVLLLTSAAVPCRASSEDELPAGQLEAGKRTIDGRAGCYLVDYSFVETTALKPGYTKDNRVYDVNRNKAVKEWIFAEQLSPTRIRLQHVLFATDSAGKLKAGSILKHTGEDWQYDAPFLYEFAGRSHWTVKRLNETLGQWTRRVTNLDDGLRYQCAARFNLSTANPEWSCDNYSPIPGRETRDMGRKDYQGLQRSTHLITYGSSWLEREDNVKTIESEDSRTPLVKEVGKNWYVRLPDSECNDAQTFTKQRLPFWLLMGQVWDKVLDGSVPVEDPPKSLHPSRYERFLEVEDQYVGKDLSDPATRSAAETALMGIIRDTRSTRIAEGK